MAHRHRTAQARRPLAPPGARAAAGRRGSARGRRARPWDVELDALRARDVLAALGPHHRAALVLRHVDGLPVPEVAAHLGRTLHATEALLVRARRAFRSAYEEGCRG